MMAPGCPPLDAPTGAGVQLCMPWCRKPTELFFDDNVYHGERPPCSMALAFKCPNCARWICYCGGHPDCPLCEDCCQDSHDEPEGA